jgi:hypothetical protein
MSYAPAAAAAPPPVPPVPIGLPNSDGGNNCFANALIQVVLHSRPLLELLLTADVSPVESPSTGGSAASSAAASSAFPAIPAAASATRQVANDAARSQMLSLQELFVEAALWVWLCRHQAKRVVLPALGIRLRALLFGSTDNQQEDAPETLDHFFNVLHESGLEPHLNLRHRSEYSYAEPRDPCAEPYLGVRAEEQLIPPPRVTPPSPPQTPRPSPAAAATAPSAEVKPEKSDQDEDMLAGDVGIADFLPESDVETEGGEHGSLDEFLAAEYDAIREELAAAERDEVGAAYYAAASSAAAPPSPPRPPVRYEWTQLHHLQRFVIDAIQKKRIVKEEVLLGELRELPIDALQELLTRLQTGADLTLLERVHALQAQCGPARDPKDPLIRAVLYLASARGRVIRWVATTGQRCYNTVGWSPMSLPSTKLDNSLQATKHERVWMLRMADMATVAQRIKNRFITFEEAFDAMFVTETEGCEPGRFLSPANLVQDFKSAWCSSNLTEIPDGFVLQLMRFGGLRKVSDPVPVSEHLTLNRDRHILRTAFDRFPGAKHISYRLRSVVVHDGSAGGGHYYSLIRDVLNRWWLCNDAKTELLESPADRIRLHRWFSLGYMYYYEREPDTSAGSGVVQLDMPGLIDRWVKRQPPSVFERFKAVRQAITERLRALAVPSLSLTSPGSSSSRETRGLAAAALKIPSASPPPAFPPNSPAPRPPVVHGSSAATVVAPMNGISCVPSCMQAQPPASSVTPNTKPRVIPRIFQHVRSARQ